LILFLIFKSYQHLKKAYTLVEIIVALAIITLMFGLGLYAANSFKSYVELQNAYTDLVGDLKTLDNAARNSVYSRSKYETTGSIAKSVPSAYTILFSDSVSQYSINYCDLNSTIYICSEDKNIVNVQTKNNIKFSSSCDQIGFKTGTGDFIAMDTAGNPTAATDCVITIIHSKISSKKTINVSIKYNKITVD
jgi:prepilin-type N-terminal cleavage/methylation domain-containing protein